MKSLSALYPLMKNLLRTALVLTLAINLSCNSDDEPVVLSLEVTNQLIEELAITNIVLEGYEFSNLSIEKNSSRSFELSDGMPSGFTNAEIEIDYGNGVELFYMLREINVNENGKTTVILQGCAFGGGCQGHDLVVNP